MTDLKFKQLISGLGEGKGRKLHTLYYQNYLLDRYRGYKGFPINWFSKETWKLYKVLVNEDVIPSKT